MYSHVVAILFKVEAFIRLELGATTCTSQPCVWNQAYSRKVRVPCIRCVFTHWSLLLFHFLDWTLSSNWCRPSPSESPQRKVIIHSFLWPCNTLSQSIHWTLYQQSSHSPLKCTRRDRRPTVVAKSLYDTLYQSYPSLQYFRLYQDTLSLHVLNLPALPLPTLSFLLPYHHSMHQSTVPAPPLKCFVYHRWNFQPFPALRNNPNSLNSPPRVSQALCYGLITELVG